MTIPTKKEIMEAYLADLQKDIALGEQLKQQLENLRTENWSLEKRNKELRSNLALIEEREKALIFKETEFEKRLHEFNQKEILSRQEKGQFYQNQIQLNKDKEEFDFLKLDLEKRFKNLIDREKAVEAEEYDLKIEKGKLEQKLRVYRDKLSIE